MEKCNHEFIGVKDGVLCRKCACFMTADEFIEWITPKAEEKPKSTKNKKTNVNKNA